MSKHNRVTSKNPKTGALPSEQTANNFGQENGQQPGSMMDNDKLIYELVQNNVEFAGNQFGENLSFNQETLTNVLYDNIYKMLGDKFDEENFVNQIAQDLIDNGCVIQLVTDQKQESNDVDTNEVQQPEVHEEVIYQIDPSAHDELCQKVYAVVDILKAEKIKIFKLFADIDNTIDSLSQLDSDSNSQKNQEQKPSSPLIQKTDSGEQKASQVGSNILARINGVSTHITETSDKASSAISDVDDSLLELSDAIEQTSSDIQKQRQKNTKITKTITTKLKTIGSNGLTLKKKHEETNNLLKKINLNPKVGGNKKVFAPVKKNIIKGLLKNTKKTTSTKISRLKSKISNSFIGKVGSGIKKTYGVIKNVKVVKTVSTVVKKTYRGAKKAAGLFIKASKAIGNIVKWVAKGAVNAIKSKGKSLVKAIGKFTLGKIVFKVGWRAIKFVGKSIWKGIKKLGLKMVKFFGKLFGIGIGFANKIGFYAAKIGKGIKDKTYIFLVRPIATLLTNVFKFTMGVVKAPIDFMKWLVPSIMDRIVGFANNIKNAAYKLLKSTWGVFKKILKNPITMMLLIGGLFYFIGPKLLDAIDGGFAEFKQETWPKIVKFATTAWNFISSIGNILFTIGKNLFDLIMWVTDPEGIIGSFLRFLWGAKKAIWDYIYDLCAVTGKDKVDILCCYLAGNYIGIFLRMLIGWIKKFWAWFSKTKTMRMILNVIKAITGFFRLFEKIGENIWGAIEAFTFNHPWDSFCRVKDAISNSIDAVGDWIDEVKAIFSDENEEYAESRIVLEESPAKSASEDKRQVTMATRSLKMKGMNGSNVLNEMDRLADLNNLGASKSALQRIEGIQNLYIFNNNQYNAYKGFIKQAWEDGNGNETESEKVYTMLLESPQFSQKLLSAFFYMNPQTGQVQSTRPMPYIKQFLDNLRDIIVNGEESNQEKLKMMIEAFDQMNEERGQIVHEQSKTITDYIEKIKKFNLESPDATKQLKDMVQELNNGDMFKNGSAQSFRQVARGDAMSQNLESVTGSKFGGGNKIVQIKIPKGGDRPPSSDFKVKPPTKDRHEVVPNIILPESLTPEPLEAGYQIGDGKDMHTRYQEHLKKRTEMQNKGYSEDQLKEMGLESMPYDEFVKFIDKKHPKTEEQLKNEAEQQERRVAGMRLAKNIQAFNAQGKDVDITGFKVNGKASILNMSDFNGMTQRMLMFSPAWLSVQGAWKGSDDELFLTIAQQNKIAQRKAEKARQEQIKKEKEEEKKRKREQEILDYSAKVSGGEIVVKIGEDVTAMREAWQLHFKKRIEMQDKGYSEDQLQQMGLKSYSWEEWKRYYRKMHGLPEDGLKRIKFDGKKKERTVDWSARKALSAEELSKYGIEMSQDGPVMIPLDKAMQAASDLLKGAKTIYSIRDGLEVMRQGLTSETETLRKKREGGMPVIAGQIGEQDSATIQPVPPDSGSVE